MAVFLTNPFFMGAAAAMERVLSREHIMTLSSTHARPCAERDLLRRWDARRYAASCHAG